MKKFFTLGLLLIFLGLVIMNKEDILSFYNTYIMKRTEQITIEKNKYYRDYDFEFVQNTDNFSPDNQHDLVNIFYTAINSGESVFSFYCPDSYKKCINDVRDLANDQDTLSTINNFVHPYNGFKHIETQYDNMGQVTITIQKSYTEEEITSIDAKVSEIESSIISYTDTDRSKIQKIHDYIINNSIYDSDRSDRNIINYKSDIAYGPLLQGYSICGGYSDAMELFLEDFGIKSYKISSERHVWNAVYLDGKWYHLDLTWDDPVTSNGTNMLEYDYFLLDTDNLLNIEQTQHQFDQNIYSELKQS